MVRHGERIVQKTTTTHPFRRALIHQRHRIYRLLSDHPRSLAGRVVHFGLALLIVLNVLAVVFESVESWSVVHGPLFAAFDTLSVWLFTIEYLLRLWCAVDLPGIRFRHPVWGRLHWMVSPAAMIDLLAILPFFLGIVLDMDLRVLRVLRIMRVLKLSRYSMALTVIVDVIRQELRSIGAMLIIFAVVLLIDGSLAYLAEHHAQPQVFQDIPSSLWWAVVTMTTLGYGDMVPVTVMGKMVAAMTAITGLGMIALPSGFLASGFAEQLRIRREEYRTLVDDVLDHKGRMGTRQRRALDEARQSLDLTEDEAIEILHAEVAGRSKLCPHCGLAADHPGLTKTSLD